jgi:hypothetical protein
MKTTKYTIDTSPTSANEKRVRAHMDATPMGQLLIKYGFDPYNTETAARRVAEQAAAEIAELRKQRDEALALACKALEVAKS